MGRGVGASDARGSGGRLLRPLDEARERPLEPDAGELVGEGTALVEVFVDAAHQAGLSHKVARLEPLICIKG